MDISKECVSVFTWYRHGLMDTSEMAAYVKRQLAKLALLKESGPLRLDFCQKDKVVLDAGCGGGLKSSKLAHYGPRIVIGIDGSRPAIKAAEALSKNLGLTNTLYLHGFLEDTPKLLASVGVAKVDFILNSQVIHHTTNWKRILKIFYEILNENGILSVGWVDPGLGWGSFIAKNKIAFALGKNKERRLKIGKFLFGWFDKKYNTINTDWNSFFADRYSAYYKVITVGQMKSALENLGFEIIESYPSIDWREWLRQESQKPPDKQKKLSKRIVNNYPFLRGAFTFVLRLKQFINYGVVRVIYCRKVSNLEKSRPVLKSPQLP